MDPQWNELFHLATVWNSPLFFFLSYICQLNPPCKSY
uniref:Uncharacterized protein n=1 Tax=Anguilla anguilla TaxID=7936 RepID=A0A0E9TCH4_ANGAN